MGCCFSQMNESGRNHPSLSLPPVPDSDFPPQLEEETVKEVLSETPTLLKQNQPTFPNKIEEQRKSNRYPILHLFPKVEEEANKKMKKEFPFLNVAATQEVSEVSETTDSTATFTEKKEDEEGEVRQRINRSPSKIHGRRSTNTRDLSYGTPDRERKSPARRSEQPSPNRRNDNSGRVGYNNNTEVGQVGRRRTTVAGNNRTWRDPGESSGRRSRSPSTRIEMGQNNSGLGRSPSTRNSRRSPARIPSVAPENSPKSDDENGLTNESLENPLVSLECFIFL